LNAAVVGDPLPQRFAKTAAGQAEIRLRARGLPRPVRNLLLIINATEPAAHWLAQVQGCNEDDLIHLFAEGLIGPVEAPAAPEATDRPDTELSTLLQRMQRTAYAPLYDALNAFGKASLGLVRGYRFALEVERCSGPDELHTLAQRFLTQVQAEQGPAALKRFAALLPGP